MHMILTFWVGLCDVVDCATSLAFSDQEASDVRNPSDEFPLDWNVLVEVSASHQQTNRNGEPLC